ncbi:MAG: ferritin [Actinomycetota bacterium]
MEEQQAQAFNEQLNEELQSAYLYLAMAAYCDAENLPGTANWLQEQAREEVGHAMRFYRFILDRGGRVSLGPIVAPPKGFPSVLGLFESALENERAVTRSIHDLYRLIEKEEDYAAHTLLEGFASEQVEEEKSVGYIINSLKRIGDDGTGLFILDLELGKRAVTQPTA